MRDFKALTFHPTTEKIVEILCKKTQNDNPDFFRVLLSYYLSKMAATMRVKIATKDRGEIPINSYVIDLASSGHGKGHSTNIIEEQLIHKFRDTFFNVTYPVVAESSLSELAVQRAMANNEDDADVFERVKKEFEEAGQLAFSFDSATPAAIKQLRYKLLMCRIGALNLEIDEVGSNLVGNGDALKTYLEMFDVGKIKQKLTKNTKENTRGEEIDGRTPANLLMFGTPCKLFDGSKIEDEFYSFLETGYARRCLFGYSKQAKKNKAMTPEEIYDVLTDTSIDQYFQDTANDFEKLADIANYNKIITVSKKVSILTIAYRLHCEELANAMGEYREIAKAEMGHRYFKALKLAGAYAFIDGDVEITKENFYHAICMVEESGKAFEQILNRDRPYVKLAKYLGAVKHEVTQAELTEDLVFYKGSNTAKQELLQLAAAWGYKNHLIIKRSITNGIEFISGETLQKTDLQHLRLSYSKDIANGYQNVQVPWDELHKLTQLDMRHWINHHSTNGHREEDTMVPGFDLLVLDVDGTATVKEVLLFLKEYKFLIYTTKRHTAKKHRFRIVMPCNYQLKLDADEYREFLRNIYEWLPFEVDTSTVDRCRKWMTCVGQYHYSTGEKVLNIVPFIPRTAKSDERKQFVATYQSMTNMERWFLKNSANGNRNQQLVRYAFMLTDLGYPQAKIQADVIAMNEKFPDKLTQKEIANTIMASVAKKIAQKATA